MKLELEPVEARVVGVLLEKEVTTPDAYPLSLNALTSGCNQRSSRDPVMDLTESDVQSAVDSLIARTVVREQGSSGGRVQRYAHRLSNRLFGELEFSAAERAAICVLLLRGAQTAGEVRTRSARLHAFPDPGAVERVLDGLATREDGPFVRALPREPGRREARFVHLLCGEPPDRPPAAAVSPASAPADDAGLDAADALEARIVSLESRLAALERALGEPDHDG